MPVQAQIPDRYSNGPSETSGHPLSNSGDSNLQLKDDPSKMESQDRVESTLSYFLHRKHHFSLLLCVY